MCSHDAPPGGIEQLTPPAGSRRKRLWELPAQCHCPLIGVCLPLDVMRRVLSKLLAGGAVADDYELHVGVVSQCGARNLISEAMQRELERRYVHVVRQFQQAKSTQAVRALWREAVQAGDVSGALWAALSHPRCDPVLLEDICRDIHMVQHQAGATQRADLNRLDALALQQRELTHALARANERLLQQQAERAAEHERHAAQLMQLRADAIRKDTLRATLHTELAELRQAMPELQPRARCRIG